MPDWIIAAALGSIVVTSVLTWILWRMNRPAIERAQRGGDGGSATYASDSGGSRRQEVDRNDTDAGDSGGGGDGGGD